MDEKIAIDLYLVAADGNNATAQTTVGLRYLRGIGLPKDLSLAEKYLRLAVDNGSSRAKPVCVDSFADNIFCWAHSSNLFLDAVSR